MSATVDSLILDPLELIGPEPPPSVEVPGAWRTSCPRLTVWEAANERGFIPRQGGGGGASSHGGLCDPGPPISGEVPGQRWMPA